MSKKKLFVVSDVHSFYTIMKDALDKAGFDPNNENLKKFLSERGTFPILNTLYK